MVVTILGDNDSLLYNTTVHKPQSLGQFCCTLFIFLQKVFTCFLENFFFILAQVYFSFFNKNFCFSVFSHGVVVGDKLNTKLRLLVGKTLGVKLGPTLGLTLGILLGYRLGVTLGNKLGF